MGDTQRFWHGPKLWKSCGGRKYFYVGDSVLIFSLVFDSNPPQDEKRLWGINIQMSKILNETDTDRKHSTRAVDWYRFYGKRTNVEHIMGDFCEYINPAALLWGMEFLWGIRQNPNPPQRFFSLWGIKFQNFNFYPPQGTFRARTLVLALSKNSSK